MLRNRRGTGNALACTACHSLSPIPENPYTLCRCDSCATVVVLFTSPPKPKAIKTAGIAWGRNKVHYVQPSAA